MAVTPKVLVESKNAENTQTLQYVTAAGVTTLIDKFTCTNYGTVLATISVNLIPNAGTAANSNLITAVKTLQPKETYTFPELVGHALAQGDSISTIASVATTLNIRASGREVT